VSGTPSQADSTNSTTDSAATVSGAARWTRVDSGLVLTTGRGAQGSPMMPVTKPNAMPGGHDVWVVATFARAAIAMRAYIAAPVRTRTPRTYAATSVGPLAWCRYANRNVATVAITAQAGCLSRVKPRTRSEEHTSELHSLPTRPSSDPLRADPPPPAGMLQLREQERRDCPYHRPARLPEPGQAAD